jgi:hypothetical protein
MTRLRLARLSLVVAIVVGVPAAFGAGAAKAPAGKLVPITPTEAAWAARAKAEYPTNMCIISDDKLGGDMGEPIDMIYRQDGKADRLITFCCKDCISEFTENPGKFLQLLDAAAAKKSGKPSEHKHP